MTEDASTARLDVWLWAARFYKTRRLAVDAIRGGKIYVNENQAKPAKSVKRGDTVRIRKGAFVIELTVNDVLEKRTSPSIAQTLYTETPESLARRLEVKTQIQTDRRSVKYPGGRPSKRDRRELDRLRRMAGS